MIFHISYFIHVISIFFSFRQILLNSHFRSELCVQYEIINKIPFCKFSVRASLAVGELCEGSGGAGQDRVPGFFPVHSHGRSLRPGQSRSRIFRIDSELLMKLFKSSRLGSYLRFNTNMV